uniref:Uncharacterized protein n=1 Tax=viral metagenome TaxID=1070528 RepID=A0A6C0BRM1_9ZZZZ
MPLTIIQNWYGRPGVYIISQETPPARPTDPFLVKIGSGGYMTEATQKKRKKAGKAPSRASVGRRLDEYLLCYPRGFMVYMLFETTKESAFKLERSIQTFLTALERKYVTTTHTHGEEWYYLSQADLPKIYYHALEQKQYKIKKSQCFPKACTKAMKHVKGRFIKGSGKVIHISKVIKPTTPVTTARHQIRLTKAAIRSPLAMYSPGTKRKLHLPKKRKVRTTKAKKSKKKTR